jgi:hypothetical protein
MQFQNRQLARLAGILTATIASFAAIAMVGTFGADGATAPPAHGAATQTAHDASTIALSETGHLHLVSKHGFTFNEQGIAEGTIRGTISVQLKIVSTNRVTAEVTISPKGGSISGYGTASYHKGETTASFSGGMSITHRSGSYAHARGSGLSFSGTIARSNYAITVHVSGRLSN